jgi:hypothetical protein
MGMKPLGLCEFDPLTRKELIAKIRTLEAQLAAAQATIEQMREALKRCTKFTQEDYDALALQPCPEVLNKVRSDAVRRCAERMPHFDGEGSVQQLMWLCEEAQRIEQGGA